MSSDKMVITELVWPQLLHLCMDFKVIWHSCSPCRVEVPFETFVHVVG